MEYKLLKEEGPDHDKRFQMQLYIGEKGFGEGIGRTKKAAQQQAAYQTILLLKGNDE